MPATTSQPAKTQPWKAHYSPVNKDQMTANQNYLVDNTGSLLIDGLCEGALHSELACARKETKAQPWKAHYSPVNKEQMTANQNYLVDNTGSLLIDGCCAGALHSELACARKETKAQPWKAHYSPVNKEQMTANQNYLVDNTGSLLIDGCCAGALHSELACVSKEGGND